MSCLVSPGFDFADFELLRGAIVTETPASAFLALHTGPGFVIPNAWDAGSARILEQVGFPAIATTSAGIAWSLGVPDGGALDLDTMLEHVGRIVAAVGVPVTADLESGYADVATTVRRAVEIGAVGGNLEDQVGGILFGIDEATERIAAARAAAPAGHLRPERADGHLVRRRDRRGVRRDGGASRPLRRGRRRLRVRAGRRRGGRRTSPR